MPLNRSTVKFNAVYYGSVTLDGRYTSSMLPWTVSEMRIRGRKERRPVIIKVGRSSLIVTVWTTIKQNRESHVVLEHKLDKIRRCIQTPSTVTDSRDIAGRRFSTSATPCSFAYLTKDSIDAPTQCCHVFETDDDNMVQDLFNVIQDATKETMVTTAGQTQSTGSTMPCSAENAMQRFEILYVGKIRVSHCKPPPTFVDEAVDKFLLHELEKLKQQQDGSFNSQLAFSEKQRHSDGAGVAVLSPSQSPHNQEQSLRQNDVTIQSESSRTLETNGAESESPSPVENVSSFHLKNNNCDSGIILSKNKSKRLTSGDTSPVHSDSSPQNEYGGSLDSGTRNRIRRSDSITHGQNRTMVFQIGLSEVSFISLDKKSTILSKSFKDIAHCSQGIKNRDHFGFICCDSISDNYFGYILKCQAQSVTEEIMTTLKQVFLSAAAQQRAIRKQFVICEACPMVWLHKLCVELEGLPVSKSHSIIMKRLDTLPSDEKTDIITKLEGAEVVSMLEENEVLMMLLRAWCEMKQAKHVHTDAGHGSKQDRASILSGLFDRRHSSNSTSVLDDLKNKARRSLSNSFETILKRKSKDLTTESFRQRSNTLDSDSRRASSGGCTPETSSPGSTPEQSCEFFGFESEQENSQEFRKRSSTIASTRDARRTSSKIAKPKTSPMMNIFIKVGNSPRPCSTPSSEDERWSPSTKEVPTATITKSTVITPARKMSGSWRQAIFNRVVTPQHKQHDPLHDMSPEMKGHQGKGPLLRNHLLKRSPDSLRFLWRKAIRQQILLIRMERENKKLKASQDAVQVKRIKLSYDEITPCLIEITKVWEEMLRSPQDSHNRFTDLVDAVKAGVPRQRRGEIWQFLAQKYKLANNERPVSKELELPAPYEDLIKQLTGQQHAILIDLGRTFPGHPYFSDSLGAGQLSLFNLLKAYSLLDTEVGYCQGLSFIAGILLLHMEDDSAFEMLKHLMFTLGIRSQFKPDMVALQIQMYQLSRLIHDQHRDLYNHFELYEIAPTLYAAPWFLTLFASQFPLGFVARVFDLILLYGIEVAFKVALVLLGNHKELIIQCNSFESVMDFLKTTLPSMGIIQMERVFNQVFAMDIGRQLISYEVEYNVLQEEMIAGDHDRVQQGVEYEYQMTIERLESSNNALKQQNDELLTELKSSRSSLMNLERQISSYQACTSRQESHLKSLTLERATLKHLVELLRRNWPSEQYDVCVDLLSDYQEILRSESPTSTTQPSMSSSVLNHNFRSNVSSWSHDVDSRADMMTTPSPPLHDFLSVRSRARNVSGDSLCSSHESVTSSEINTE